jgi:hypothetical protein
VEAGGKHHVCLILLGWAQQKRCGARYLPHLMHGRVLLRESIAFSRFCCAFLKAFDYHGVQTNTTLSTFHAPK